MHFQHACYAYYIVGPCTKLRYIGSNITQQIKNVINVLLKLCVLCIVSLALRYISVYLNYKPIQIDTVLQTHIDRVAFQ